MVDERLEFLESLDDSRLIDPLNEVTRKERRALLGTSLLTLAIVWGNLVPKEIKALDIKIEASEEAGLFLSLSVALLYFILAFIVCAYSDFTAWRRSKEVLQARINKLHGRIPKNRSPGDAFEIAIIADDAHVANDILASTNYRAVFDLLLPLFAGSLSLSISLNKLATLKVPSEESTEMDYYQSAWAILSHPWPLVIMSTGCAIIVVSFYLRYHKTHFQRSVSRHMEANVDTTE